MTDGGVPAVVPPAAKVRLTIPDCVAGSSQSTVQQLAEDLKTMHSYFKQAIEHVAVHVDGNSAAIAGIRSDMNEVKLACKESPTLLEFQEVEVALTKQVTQTAVHENTFEAFKTDVAAISARLEGIVGEVKEALKVLDQANSERIADTNLLK